MTALVVVLVVAALLAIVWAARRNGGRNGVEGRCRTAAEREEARSAREARRRQLGPAEEDE